MLGNLRSTETELEPMTIKKEEEDKKELEDSENTSKLRQTAY